MPEPTDAEQVQLAGQVPVAEKAELRRRTEDWFVHRGVPHLIEDYTARDDIFTRAWPVLAVVFLAELALPLSGDEAWWFNTLVVIVGMGAIVGALAAVNRMRRRPWYRRPDTIGPVELTAFVVVPALVQLTFGEPDRTLATLAANLVVLGTVYVVTSYGLVPMTRWALVVLARQIGDVANLMVRSLPLLLVFTMFMFVNAELWKVASDIPALLFGAAVGLLVVVGSAFLLLRLPRELAGASELGSPDEVRAQVAGTPVAPLLDGEGEPLTSLPLGRRARANLGLVMFTSQSIQIIFVTLAIGGFYTLFGLLTVSADTIALWTGTESGRPLVSWDVAGHEMALTGALIRSAVMVAAIAGLQFTVSALTDRTYREEFAEQTLRAVRTNLAVRAVYLDRLVG